MMSKTSAARQSGADRSPWWWGSLLLMPVRWVTGFMFLSAFIRRTISQPAKMDPLSAAYNGKKFAQFLPHAIAIKPMLEYLLHTPGTMYVFLWFFTIVEGLVGLFLITGFLTRFSAFGSALVSFGILLGSGWLGSTCVDEWQIGTILTMTGLAIALAGSGGPLTVDGLLLSRYPSLREKGWFKWLFSGDISLEDRKIKTWAIIVASVAALVTLWSYQETHGGLWGGLYNDSKTPHLVITQQVVRTDGQLTFNVYRDNGPDTYGSFVTEIQVKDAAGKVVEDYTGQQLSKVKQSDIVNDLDLAKVVTTPYSLMVPLAGNAKVTLAPAAQNVSLTAGEQVSVTLIDVSGAKWSVNAKVQ